MKKTAWIILVLLAALFLWGIVTYNGFVKTEEQMTQAWSQVENVYQRRMELIPNLVSVVKAYSDYESKTMVEVVEQRTNQVAAEKINPESITQEQLSQYSTSQQLLGDAVSDILVSIENYPELKAMDSYQTFLAQYEGSENRILMERRRYNDMVQAYNKSVRRFPSSIIAQWFGFEPHPYFKN